MQIVIDIPEEDWKFIKESDGCRWSRAIIEGVINGTPLPKGHGRLIDANELEECKEIMNTISGESKYAVRMDDIRNMSTIVEAESEGNA